MVDVDDEETVIGEDLEDYIESIYNYDYSADERFSSQSYSENFDTSDDGNHFGQEWDLMENDRIDQDVDTRQDYTVQSFDGSSRAPVALEILQSDGDHFGQEWDIMEEYIDEQISPSHYNVAESEHHITSPSGNFGQSWDLMPGYVPPTQTSQFTHNPPEVQEVEVGVALKIGDFFGQERSEDYEVEGSHLVETEQRDQEEMNINQPSNEVNPSIGGDLNQQMEEYQYYYDHNQDLAFNSEIVPDQEENPYYNSNPRVMVHEHLIDDYSDSIPTINFEAKNDNGLLYEDNKSPYNDALTVEDTLAEVESNHVNISHQSEDKDNISRNTKVDILSEMETEVTEVPKTMTTATTQLTMEQTEATTLPPSETTELVTEPTTILPETIETTETTTTPEDLITTVAESELSPPGLPYNIDALSLVSMTSLSREQEDDLTTPLLPFPEPLSAAEQTYSLPAGHGLRFKFRINELKQYIPNFGFRTDE